MESPQPINHRFASPQRPPQLLDRLQRVFNSPLGFSLITGSLFLIFVVTMILSFGPVAVVEAKYQLKKTSQALFGTTRLGELLVPNFDNLLDFRGGSTHTEYGISIPKLYLDEPVIFNTDPNDKTAYTQALKQGIAHASGTAFPDNAGLGYYFAHSSEPDLRSQYNAVFYLLGKLEPSDDIFIWHDGQRYEYDVTEKIITSPGDVSFLYDKEYDNETIVLQTCWPPGTTQQRMLVFAQRVEE
jgi:LPXTG-site transpeptidase (sortase) family protein